MIYLNKYISKVSLTVKIIILTVTTGIIIWSTLDYIVHRSYKKLFETHITGMLKQQAQEDRLRFDDYLNDFTQLVNLFTTSEKLRKHLRQNHWGQQQAGKVIINNHYPSWFPGRSLLRSLANPRFAIIFDSRGIAREVYHRHQDNLPDTLLHPSEILLENSRQQTNISTINNQPYIISSKQIAYPDGITASILLASPLDDEIFLFIQGDFPKHLVGIVDTDTNTVLTSSDPVLLPSGKNLEEAKKDYLFRLREFKDYGGAEIPIQFISFIAREQIKSLVTIFVGKERLYRTITAFSLIASFILLILGLTLRIEKLTNFVNDFAQRESYGMKSNHKYGDQISILEENFKNLVNEIEMRNSQLSNANEELSLTIKDLIQTKDELVQAEKLAIVGQMSGVVAHEILNPISAIAIRLEKNLANARKTLLVLEKQQNIIAKLDNNHSGLNGDPDIFAKVKENLKMLTKITQAQQENQHLRLTDLEFIDRLVTKLIKIVDGFRQMSKTKKQIEPINLHLLINEVIADLQDQLQKNKIKLNLQLAQTEIFEADYMELNLVISNLLRNAIQAIEMHPQKTNHSISIDLTSNKNDCLKILIHDTGIGIPKDNFEKIFAPTFTSKGKKGTGVGLSVSRKIVRSYHGELSLISSESDKGTTFQIELCLPSSVVQTKKWSDNGIRI